MVTKPDLNKLKTEIHNRKRERVAISESIQGATLLPKDEFLNGLMASLQTGKSSSATNLIKLVENKTAQRLQETPVHNVQPVQSPAPVQPQQRQRITEVDMSPERDEQMFRDLEIKKSRTLAESMQEYIQTPHVGAPMSNKVPAGQQLNEGYLVENVKRVVNNYLAENLGPIFEEAIKSTIIEMYAVERIKEVLQENKEMIKTVVIETIKEIQARNKAKTQ